MIWVRLARVTASRLPLRLSQPSFENILRRCLILHYDVTVPVCYAQRVFRREVRRYGVLFGMPLRE